MIKIDSPRIYIFRSFLATAASNTTASMTLGDSYCTVRIPETYRHDIRTDADVTNYPGGKAQIFRWQQFKKNGNTIRFHGFVKEDSPTSTVAVKVACETYIVDRMSRGTNPEGFLVKLTSTVYDKWSNEDGASKDVARGVLKDLTTEWMGGDENLGFYVKGVFELAWD